MSKVVLLVEDEFAVQAALASTLRDEGVEVLCAADVRAALALLASRKVDLVLCDFMLPGPSGTALFGTMQGNAAWKSIPFVLLNDGREVPGAALVLKKPVKFTDLPAILALLA